MASLTVLLDHVAFVRQGMQSNAPDPVAAAILAELAGADGIGVYLREDRRLTQERDVRLLRQTIQTRLVLHMAATSEMVGIALDIKPERVVLMPEIREESAAENGMDLAVHGKAYFETVDTLQSNGISVGICIMPEPEQVKVAHQMGANWVQLHAGRLSVATSPPTQTLELDAITNAVKMAHKLRLRIAVGHGLNYRLIKLFKGLEEIDEFSFGRSIIARALLTGINEAVREMRALIDSL